MRLARRQWDVLVVGGGSAGCVLAARLCEETERSVCLVEAGPDYGPRSGDRWPEELLDPRHFPASHDQARGRRNLSILPGVTVDRVVIDRGAAVGVVTSEGTLRACRIVLCAGAYLTPAILMRSGIGPDPELRRLGIRTLEALPVGEQLLDHVGCVAAWEPSLAFHEATREPLRYDAPVVVQAASSLCSPGVWDLQLLSWSIDGLPTGYAPAIAIFHMKPRSSGRVRLGSNRSDEFPRVERGFLTEQDDMTVILDGLSIAQSLVETAPLRSLVRRLRLPASAADRRRYVRANIRSYFHMSGTCAIGRVVDDAGAVLGVSGLVVADASIMPTIPRANTNLTVLAVAEQIAARM